MVNLKKRVPLQQPVIANRKHDDEMMVSAGQPPALRFVYFSVEIKNQTSSRLWWKPGRNYGRNGVRRRQLPQKKNRKKWAQSGRFVGVCPTSLPLGPPLGHTEITRLHISEALFFPIRFQIFFREFREKNGIKRVSTIVLTTRFFFQNTKSSCI